MWPWRWRSCVWRWQRGRARCRAGQAGLCRLAALLNDQRPRERREADRAAGRQHPTRGCLRGRPDGESSQSWIVGFDDEAQGVVARFEFDFANRMSAQLFVGGDPVGALLGRADGDLLVAAGWDEHGIESLLLVQSLVERFA